MGSCLHSLTPKNVSDEHEELNQQLLADSDRINYSVFSIPLENEYGKNKKQIFRYYQKAKSKEYLIMMNNRCIYKYDVQDKNWITVVDKIPKCITNFKADIDEEKNKLFILCPQTFAVFDLETNKWKMVHQYNKLYHDITAPVPKISSMLAIFKSDVVYVPNVQDKSSIV